MGQNAHAVQEVIRENDELHLVFEHMDSNCMSHDSEVLGSAHHL